MNRITLSLIVSALALGWLGAAPAQAQLARTFVSAARGNDSNDCSRAAPCQHFQAAHDKTLPNGEITVLDPGSYGAVTIGQNISIINDGVGEAGLLVSGGLVGITVNAPGAAVTLRGITIKGIGFGGGNGIAFMAGKALNVENCTIRNLDGSNVGNGIVFAPSTGTANLTVTNTMITDNANDAILVQPTGSAIVTGFLTRVGLHSNGSNGLDLLGFGTTGTIHVTVTDSAVTNSGGIGNFRLLANGPTTFLTVIRSLLANSNAGVGIGNGIVRITQSAVMGNTFGWFAQGGLIATYGDNLLVSNDSNPGPVISIAKQ